MFDNDLLNAVFRADETTLAGIRELMLFMHNYAPARCWGSPETARRWRTDEAEPGQNEAGGASPGSTSGSSSITLDGDS